MLTEAWSVDAGMVSTVPRVNRAGTGSASVTVVRDGEQLGRERGWEQPRSSEPQPPRVRVRQYARVLL